MLIKFDLIYVSVRLITIALQWNTDESKLRLFTTLSKDNVSILTFAGRGLMNRTTWTFLIEIVWQSLQVVCSRRKMCRSLVSFEARVHVCWWRPEVPKKVEHFNTFIENEHERELTIFFFALFYTVSFLCNLSHKWSFELKQEVSLITKQDKHLKKCWTEIKF